MIKPIYRYNYNRQRWESIGERIRFARATLDMSQNMLANRAGIRQSTLSDIEANKTVQPRSLRAIAKVLMVGEYWLRYGHFK